MLRFIGPVSRIVLRYASGFLIARGLPDELVNMIANDPEIVMAIEVGVGIALGALAETAYAMAKKFNWRT